MVKKRRKSPSGHDLGELAVKLRSLRREAIRAVVLQFMGRVSAGDEHRPAAQGIHSLGDTLSQPARKDLFLNMMRRMDMSYSYKPVLIQAILHHTDEKGRVKLSNISDYFRAYYERRRAAGLVVEKPEAYYQRFAEKA